MAFRSEPRPVAPARLLPSGDADYLLWETDREILVPEPKRRGQLWTTRVWPGAVLVNGEIAGVWRRSAADVSIDLWRRLSSAEWAAVEAEALSLPLRRPITVRRTHATGKKCLRRNRFSRGSYAVATRCPRPGNVNDIESLLGAVIHVLVDGGSPVFMRQSVSLAVQIFQGALQDEQDLAVFLQHQRMNRPGRFMNDVANARHPVMFQIAPGTAKRETEYGTIMAMNAEIPSGGPTQFHNPLTGRRLRLNQLHFTSSLPIGKPRCVVGGNIQCVEGSSLHLVTSLTASHIRPRAVGGRRTRSRPV